MRQYWILELCENQNFLDIGQLPQTALECRTVRIGSYKYIPREKVVISHTGVRFSVPLLEDGMLILLTIEISTTEEIINFLNILQIQVLLLWM